MQQAYDVLTWYIKIRNLGFFSCIYTGDEKMQNSRLCQNKVCGR